MKPGVKALVIYHKKILLILRDNNPNIPYPNTWNLPGGGVEEGESYDQAMLREFKEELGIDPRNMILLGEEVFDDGRNVIRYLITLTDDEVNRLKLNEGQRMQFFTIDEALELDYSPYLGNFIKREPKHLKEIVESELEPDLGKLKLKSIKI